MKPAVNIFWLRRDLRFADNAGLYHALRAELPVIPVFIFDRDILDKLENKSDRRVQFIHQALSAMQLHLLNRNSTILVFNDTVLKAFRKLLENYHIQKVFCNHDYEPYARERDQAVGDLLRKSGVTFHTYKDQVIFEKDEVLKDDGTPYTVFTPYSKRWKSHLNEAQLKSYPTVKYINNFYCQQPKPIPSLSRIGFRPVKDPFPSGKLKIQTLKNYGELRNYPAMEGTSRMGIHIRFGTVSIRELVRKAVAYSETFLIELIWREFYQMILWHFPRVGQGKSFKAEYDYIKWRNNESEFEKWCRGKTGYPIVDAGMRELNETGYMHNRVRMIVASFLSKHLLIDWRWGEAYFAEKLLDFDLASNNGGWQWAAGCGCDAAPYFRIFNPSLQAEKFDPGFVYIKKWVPEFGTSDYPAPMVDHNLARKRCLDAYGRGIKKSVVTFKLNGKSLK